MAAVTGRAAAQGPPDPQHLTLVEDLRIGSLEGPSALSAVHSVAITPDGGRIFVSQSREQSVKAFDARTGSLIRTFGRAGQGPGEFRSVGLLSIRADTLFAADPFQQRFVLFDLEGEHVETQRVGAAPPPGFERPPLPAVPAPGGLVWGEPGVNVGSVAVGQTTHVPLVVMRRTGEHVRTISVRPVAGRFTAAEAGGRAWMFAQPLARLTHLSAYSPDGDAVALVQAIAGGEDEGAFRVTRITPAGDTVYDRRFNSDPVRVSAADRDRIIRDFADQLSGDGQYLGPALAVAREHLLIPEILAPFEKVLVGTDGRVWLKRQSLSAPQATWLVLDPVGRLLATVAAPAGADLLHAGPDHVWGVVTDALDVPYVVRWRLTPRGE